jgi:spore germination protein YaaH
MSAALKPPATYSEWAEMFDMLKARTNDEDVLAALKSGTIAWQSGVAERFAQKLVNTINARMNAATDKFQKELNRGNSEGATVQAILALRREMAFLHTAIDLPAIPESDRAQYIALVRGQADKMQEALEESAKKDRSGKMSSLIRNHRVNAFQ